MDENPDKLDEYLNQMVDLQLTIHSKTCPLLNKLKDKMRGRSLRLRKRKKAAEEALQTLQTEIARCMEGMEKGKSELIELLNSKASIKARQQRFDTMEEQVNIRKAQLNQRLLARKTEEADLDSVLAEYQKDFDSVNQKIKRAETGRTFHGGESRDWKKKIH